VRVSSRQLCNLRCKNRRYRICVGRVVYLNDLAYAGKTCRLSRDQLTIFTQDSNVNIGTRDSGSTSDTLGGTGIQPFAIVLGNDEDLDHHNNPLSFIAATSPATSETITPF
jgi:hypothetical protein